MHHTEYLYPVHEGCHRVFAATDGSGNVLVTMLLQGRRWGCWFDRYPKLADINEFRAGMNASIDAGRRWKRWRIASSGQG